MMLFSAFAVCVLSWFLVVSVLVAVLVSCVDGLALDLPVAWSVVLGCFVEVFPVSEDVVPLAEEFSVVVRPDLPWPAPGFWVSGFSVFGLVVFVFGLVVLVLSWIVVVLVVLCGCSAFLVVGLLGCSVPAEVSGAVVPAALDAALR
ncbi:Uncharacterised protein [Mycobacteroides abscessus subsp. bolletii]|uniref:hypothetical protein n=1 Tax=Mycobacteroides abscessus TaxID=36809 RepID=UPI0009C663D8|nr:hypothetical protein [Mycobacteroides abscessus]SLI65620.1 Uncharacterised protein [Mycobacteroides abscessus subsp. bolletii]